jgi:(2Fe-2S) ferredoxin
MSDLTQSNMQNFYQYHVFFCLNQRPEGEDCCMNKGAEAAFDHMKARVKKLGLSGKDKVRINRSGCLDRCGEGPLMVVYPEAVWYTFVDMEDLDEIIESHLMNGKVVTRLVV